MVLSDVMRQENVRVIARHNPVGITALEQDFCIKCLVWPNMENKLKEKIHMIHLIILLEHFVGYMLG